MRAIATVAAISLLAVGLTQRAAEAPRPATAEVACPSATGCVAIGGSNLLVEQSGKWTAVREPSTLSLISLACPKAGKCVAAGFSGERRAVVLTQAGTQWSLTVPALPGSPADPSFPALGSVSCASAGNCTAVGAYQNPVLTPLVVTERSGAWGVASDAQLPADAATSKDPDHADTGGSLSLVSCPSADNCTAVGTYTNKDAQYSQYGWTLTDRTSAAQLPADAKVYGDPGRGGTSPFFGFTGLSCPSAGNCTAVGGYWGRGDVQQGLLLIERNGTWSQGITAPVPANAGPNAAGANEFENPLDGVSCAAANDCAAIGWYVDKSKRRHGLLLTEKSGKWRAHELALPGSAPRKATVNLSSVTCASRGHCVAVGDYTSAGKAYGVIDVERGWKWGRAVTAILPSNAAPSRHTFLKSVSCASPKACTVVGDYAARPGTTAGLLLALRLG